MKTKRRIVAEEVAKEIQEIKKKLEKTKRSQRIIPFD